MIYSASESSNQKTLGAHKNSDVVRATLSLSMTLLFISIQYLSMLVGIDKATEIEKYVSA